MNVALRVLSWLALGATVIAPAAYLGGAISLPTVHTLLWVAAIVWFVSAPLARRLDR